MVVLSETEMLNLNNKENRSNTEKKKKKKNPERKSALLGNGREISKGTSY